MNKKHIEHQRDLFHQRLKTGENLSVEQFLIEQQLPPDEALLEALRKVQREYGELADSHPAEDASTAVWTGNNDDHNDTSSPRLPERIGNFEIIAQIARGGMGVVYKARHRILNRIVALKMIRSGALADANEQARFRTEAEAAARMDHPHIVPIFEVGEFDGQHYFAMGYVDGGSLAERVAEGPLAPREAAQLVLTVADAVAYAHQRGILHRDLKPANILLDASGQPRVADFGLAKRIESDSGLTVTGTPVGTPSYMPPEQALGAIHQVGPEADVYSLGAILYCLLTGRPPFRSTSVAETLRQVVEEEPVPVRQTNPEVSPDIETICLKCLQKQQDKRYPTVTELADELRRWLRGEPIKARPVSRLERCRRWCGRNPVVASLMAGIALTMLSATVVSSILAVRMSRASKLAGAEKTKAEQGREQSETARHALELQLALNLIDEGKFREAEQQLRKVLWNRRGWEYDLVINRLKKAYQPLPAAHHNVFRVAWSPDGQRIAVAGGTDDGRQKRIQVAYICDASPGSFRTTLFGHKSVVSSIAFDLTGNLAVTASWDHSARIWDAATGRERRVLDGHNRQVSDAAFTPDGRHVATASWDNTLRIWSTDSGEQVSYLHLPSPAHRVVYHPQGDRIVGGCLNGQVFVWNVAEAGARQFLSGHTQLILSVAVHPDGDRIASVEQGPRARLWSLQNQTSQVIELPFRLGTSVAFSPDGRVLAIGGEGIVLWDVESARAIKTLAQGGGLIESIAFSPDGGRLLAGDQRGRIRALSVAIENDDSTTFSDANAWASAVAINPHGDRLAIGREDGSFAVVDPRSSRSYASGRVGSSAVLSAAFDDEGDRLALGTADGTVTVVDSTTGELRASFPLTFVLGNREVTGQVVEIAIAPAGDQLAAAVWRPNRDYGMDDGDKRMGVWRIADGKRLFFFEGYDGANPPTVERKPADAPQPIDAHPRSLHYSPNGKWMAAGVKHFVHFWNAQTGKFAFKTTSTGSTVHALDFGQGGRILAQSRGASAVDRHDQIALITLPDSVDGLNLKVPFEQQMMAGHVGVVQSLAISPAGDRLASAALDGTVKVWETRTGQELLQLPTRPFGVRRLRWSRDGRRLTCAQFGMGTLDRPRFRIRAFNAEDGTVAMSIASGSRAVLDLGISSDNRRLASVDALGFVRVLDLTSQNRLLELRVDEKVANRVALSPTGNLVVVNGRADAVDVYDVDTGELIRTIDVSGNSRVWRTGEEATTPARSAARSDVLGLTFDPTGNLLAVSLSRGSRNKSQHSFGVWDVRDGTLLRGWGPHDGDMANAKLATFRQYDGALMAVCNGRVALIPTPLATTHVHWLESPTPLRYFSLSVDGRRVATTGQTFDLKDLSWGQIAAHSLPDRLPGGAWTLPRAGATGTQAAYFDWDNGSLAIYDCTSATELWQIDMFPSRSQVIESLESGVQSMTGLARYSPDGSLLVIADMSGLDTRDGNLSNWGGDVTVWTWDAGEPDTLRTLPGEHEKDTRALAFSPDGHLLASVGFDRKLVVTDVKRGSAPVSFRQFPMYGVAFDPTGNLLAVKSVENRLFVLPPTPEVADLIGRVRQVFGNRLSSYRWSEFTSPGDYHGEEQFAFSPNGQRLVFGVDKDVLVIDPRRSDVVVQTLQGHSHDVDGSLFHPDGRRVISYAAHDSLCIWDSHDGTLLRRLAMPGSRWFQPIDVTLDPAVRQRAKELDAITMAVKNLGLAGSAQFFDANIKSIAVSANGESVFAAIDCLLQESDESYRDRYCVVELDSAALTLKSVIDLPGYVRTIAVSTDGRWLACGGAIGSIEEARGLVSLVHLSSGKIVLQREGDFGLVTSVAFDPLGGRLAFSSRDTEVLVWQYEVELKDARP